MSEASKKYSVLGIIGLVFIVLSFIPFAGIIFLPLSLIFSALSLIKKNNTMAAITFALGLMKMFITPALWITGFSQNGSFLLPICIVFLFINAFLIVKNNMRQKKY